MLQLVRGCDLSLLPLSPSAARGEAPKSNGNSPNLFIRATRPPTNGLACTRNTSRMENRQRCTYTLYTASTTSSNVRAGLPGHCRAIHGRLSPSILVRATDSHCCGQLVSSVAMESYASVKGASKGASKQASKGKQGGRQAGRQACRQAGRQAGRQTRTGGPPQKFRWVSVWMLGCWLQRRR